ncbi:hypothetical protein [Arcobacter sp. CECT 8985]|uniref:hypothetical protein n=1 Tax=Arcobacter sp. CECT 8985 TaxID=1935424 RepID=UPI00100ACA35|nr:hypothetical protein [Arcobacter sp. CECT 8985]RXJ85631.1 hypothetical protein CRU93_11085 [Arcobacter sp. CECT 8985]
MGIFDISIQQKSHNIEKKDEIINRLNDTFKTLSEEFESNNDLFVFKKFKAEKCFLSYDLKATVKKTKESFTIDFEGELQNVWILVILIVIGILVTYGIGVILIAFFAYLQKKSSTKYIENTFEKIKKETPPK